MLTQKTNSVNKHKDILYFSPFNPWIFGFVHLRSYTSGIYTSSNSHKVIAIHLAFTLFWSVALNKLNGRNKACYVGSSNRQEEDVSVAAEGHTPEPCGRVSWAPLRPCCMYGRPWKAQIQPTMLKLVLTVNSFWWKMDHRWCCTYVILIHAAAGSSPHL